MIRIDMTCQDTRHPDKRLRHYGRAWCEVVGRRFETKGPAPIYKLTTLLWLHGHGGADFEVHDDISPTGKSGGLAMTGNGSRVVSLPGTAETVRGFSAPRLVIEDEAAFVEDGLYGAVRPMLAVSSGRLILMSTPHGKRGHFHEAWKDGGPEWLKIEVKALDCPRISEAFLETERREIGDLWFRQEYGCEFLETIVQVFRYDDIVRALSDEVEPLFGSDDNRPAGDARSLLEEK